MNALSRAFIIVIVALLIGGVMFTAVSAVSDAPPPDTAGVEVTRPPRPEGGEDHSERGEGFEGGFFLPMGMVKSIIFMTAAAGVYTLIVSVAKRSRKQKSQA